MNRSVILILLVVAFSQQAARAEEPEKPNEALLQEMERLKTENAIAAARYGEPLQPKSGAIDGSEKLIPLLAPQVPELSRKLAQSLATQIKRSDACKYKSGDKMEDGLKVIVDQDIPVARLTLATSNYEALANLESAIKNIENPGPGMALSIPVAFSMIGGVASVFKLFQSDYKVGGANIDLDMDWFVAALVNTGAHMTTERFPRLADIQLVVDDLAELQKRAGATKNADIIKAVNTFIGSVTSGGSSAPIVAMAQYRPLRGRQDYCLVFVKAGLSALSMTRTGAFGGGGKAYLRGDMIATALLVEANGTPQEQICVTSSISGAVDMKELTSKGVLPTLRTTSPTRCTSAAETRTTSP